MCFLSLINVTDQLLCIYREAIPIPQVLKQCLKNRTSLTSRNEQLYETTLVKVIDLVQMSDLIIFDFIVRNADR